MSIINEQIGRVGPTMIRLITILLFECLPSVRHVLYCHKRGDSVLPY